MKELLREKLQKIFTEKEWSFAFEVMHDSLYAIEVTARAYSWWQNFKHLRIWPNDDDLALGIDEMVFQKQSGARGVFDSEVAFNGNNLKGLQKTVLILMRLKQGQHTIRFFADKTPTLGTLAVYELQDHERTFLYLPPDNYPIEDGDRRPWLTIAVVNQDVQLLRIKAAASQGQRDDEDVKLLLNSEVQENHEPKSHAHWFWCGRTLKGREKIFEKKLDPSLGTHYMEFWADKSPTIQEIALTLGGLPRVPTVDNPIWTGNFRDDLDEMLLARLIFGEAENQGRETKIWIGGSVLNRVSASAWPDTLYEVILQRDQYDPLKSTDSNYSKVIDPLRNSTPSRRESWRESYEIARGLLLGEIQNPTTATHFHGLGVSRARFMRIIGPQGKFLRKIDDTSFYWAPH
jgi:hypothetical protein